MEKYVVYCLIKPIWLNIKWKKKVREHSSLHFLLEEIKRGDRGSECLCFLNCVVPTQKLV